MSGIFISYRREDSAFVSGLIHERLAAHFGSDTIFTDVDSIPLGVNFKKYIDDQVGKCDIFLAVIGEKWVSVSGEGDRPRIENPEDFVRLEIESALKREIPVIPLLVGDITIPSTDALPDSLKELALRNATPIRPKPTFDSDVERLIRGIEKHLDKQAKAEAEREAQEEERRRADAEAKRQAEAEQQCIALEEARQQEEQRDAEQPWKKKVPNRTAKLSLEPEAKRGVRRWLFVGVVVVSLATGVWWYQVEIEKRAELQAELEREKAEAEVKRQREEQARLEEEQRRSEEEQRQAELARLAKAEVEGESLEAELRQRAARDAELARQHAEAEEATLSLHEAVSELLNEAGLAPPSCRAKLAPRTVCRDGLKLDGSQGPEMVVIPGGSLDLPRFSGHLV